MFAAIRHRASENYRRWVDRRIPRAKEVTLNQRRIFIFPSRQGLFFFVVLLIMLLGAINYQNNMAFALVFLLMSLFVVTVLHTFANLSGLTIQALRSHPGFAGERVVVELKVSRNNQRTYHNIHLGWPDSDGAVVSLVGGDSQTVTLSLAVTKRGIYRPGRLLLESFYPLGLLRCWTWIDLDIQALVYPRPLHGQRLPDALSASDDGEVLGVEGSDDFYGLQQYRAGDSPKHIFWKSYAKGQNLQTKQYAAFLDQNRWLDWQQLTESDTERRLSQLCGWALSLDRQGEAFGLRLPEVELLPGKGGDHLYTVLRHLALFGIKELDR